MGTTHDGYFIDRIEDAAGNVFNTKATLPKSSEDSNYLMVDMLRNTMTEGTTGLLRATCPWVVTGLLSPGL